MLKQLRKWNLFTLLVPVLLGQPFVSNAQNPLKQAAREAKVTPDLLGIQPPTHATNAPMLAPNAPTSEPGKGLVFQNPYVIVDNTIAIEAVSSDGNGQELLERLQALGLRNGAAFRRMVSGYLPIDKIGELKNVRGLKFVRPAYEPQHNVGTVGSQGDKAMRADDARKQYGVTGGGTKIGILSDSYNKLGGAAASVASGDLPSGVQVLLDYQQPNATDEGRAMAELVHDVAPGAAIAFHTAEGGQAIFAKGIKDLAAAGCNIIVDDIIYFAEPFFQDGIVAQAADEVVTTNNVTYFSASGNQARSSYQAGFKNSRITVPGYGQAHDFGGGDTRQRVTIPAGGSFQIVFQWDDPFFSVSGAPGARSDLDILVFAAGTETMLAGSFTDNLETGDPFEFVTVTNRASTPLSIDIAITKEAGPDPGIIKWVNFGSRDVTIEHDTKSPASYGHSNATRAISVGAAAYFNTPAYNADLTTAIAEGFSSAGGTPILFTATGQRINGTVGIIRQKPDITAADGGNTTFFGQDVEPDGFPNFFGTSAAAPHAAAIAALMQQKANNGLSPGSILSIMKATALDMDDPGTPGFDTGFDFRTGYGFIRADRALQAVNQPLALVQPEYNCNTGQITFQTTGGNGSRIEYQGSGITSWNPNPVQFIDAPVRADRNSTTIVLQARQSGVIVSYTFNFRIFCQGSPTNTNHPPVLDRPISTQFAQQGNGFSFQFPASTFKDPDGDALVYTAMDLPAGLTFDAANRRVTGTPTQTGTFPVIIKATDPGNLVAQALFNIVVSPTAGNQSPALALIAPLYDCLTGVITFRTINGDGTPIRYAAAGIARNAPTDATGVVEAGLRRDPKPIVITATQGKVTVSYTFDLAAFCRGGNPPTTPPAPPTPPPPSPTPPSTGVFALAAPVYNCATGAFTFQSTNGAGGRVVEYAAAGITGWTTNPTHTFSYDLRTAGDVKPLTLQARYVGAPGSMVTLVWTRPAPCTTSPTPPPPTPPSTGVFALVAPVYNCATGAFTFQSTNGVAGRSIEYASMGITGWTTNPNHTFNYDLRVSGDVKPLTLQARYVGSASSMVTLVWTRPAPCSAGARVAALEPSTGVQITVLGNPTQEERVEIDVLGGAGKLLQLRVSNGQGNWVSEQTVEMSGTVQRQHVLIGRLPGIYLLQVGTDTDRKTVKIVRQ